MSDDIASRSEPQGALPLGGAIPHPDSPIEKLLTDQETRDITLARTASWLLESSEHSYDASIRLLYSLKSLIDFSAILIAIVFLFLQYLAKDKNPTLHDTLGVVGTGLSLFVVLLTVWGLVDRWTDRIEKKQELSRRIRELLTEHRLVTTRRPVDEKKIHAWLTKCDEFGEAKKHLLATLLPKHLISGFQHMANLHPDSGVTCPICGNKWSAASNAKARTWIRFKKCSNCGV